MKFFEIDEALVLSCGWTWWHENVLAISDRPLSISRDDEGRLHSLTGPSIAYRDGWSLWHVHGVSVPQVVIEQPETITVAQIDAEQNAEVRRVMIERYRFGLSISGPAAYLIDSGAELLDHHDTYGRLLRRAVPNDEPILMVQVLNPTPEPDGTLSEHEARIAFGDVVVDANLADHKASIRAGDEPRFKQYFLRVHPQLVPMKNGKAEGEPQKLTAKNAVASTWGMRGEDFDCLLRA